MKTIGAKLEELRSRIDCNLALELNEHNIMYERAQSYYTNFSADPTIVGDMDWDKDIWALRVYDRTPVGFYYAIGNDLESLIDYMIGCAKGSGRLRPNFG